MNNNKISTLKTLLQMAFDHQMNERFYTKSMAEWIPIIRWQGDRLRTLAEHFEQISQEELEKAGADAVPTMEDRAPLTISQLEIINNRSSIPHIALLYYGNGGAPVEFEEIKSELKKIEEKLRASAEENINYMEKHFLKTHPFLIEPKVEWLEAAVWRSRLTASYYCIGSYDRIAAEMIGLAIISLNKAKLSGTDLMSKENRYTAVLLLNTVSDFLYEAAKYIALAVAEIGGNDHCWRHYQLVIKQIIDEGTIKNEETQPKNICGQLKSQEDKIKK